MRSGTRARVIFASTSKTHQTSRSSCTARFEKMKKLGIINPKWELSPSPETWESQQHKEWEARCMEVYAAQIDRMDQNIGKILEALDASKQLENTLVLFLQDNGGCAEKMGRQEHKDRTTAPASQPMKPDQIQQVVFP